MFNIGNIMNDLLQGQLSLERIQKFLFAEEINAKYITRTNDLLNPTAIKVVNGNFHWVDKNAKKEGYEVEKSQKNKKKTGEPVKLTDQHPPIVEISKEKPEAILKSINMNIKRGSFVAILGE